MRYLPGAKEPSVNQVIEIRQPVPFIKHVPGRMNTASNQYLLQASSGDIMFLTLGEQQDSLKAQYLASGSNEIKEIDIDGNSSLFKYVNEEEP